MDLVLVVSFDHIRLLFLHTKEGKLLLQLACIVESVIHEAGSATEMSVHRGKTVEVHSDRTGLCTVTLRRMRKLQALQLMKLSRRMQLVCGTRSAVVAHATVQAALENSR